MDEERRRTRGRRLELTSYQRDVLDEYFYKHDIKLTKKNLKIASKDLNIPHRRIVEYVNSRQKESREAAYEEHMHMLESLLGINMQIKEIWSRFNGHYK